MGKHDAHGNQQLLSTTSAVGRHDCGFIIKKSPKVLTRNGQPGNGVGEGWR